MSIAAVVLSAAVIATSTLPAFFGGTVDPRGIAFGGACLLLGSTRLARPGVLAFWRKLVIAIAITVVGGVAMAAGLVGHRSVARALLGFLVAAFGIALAALTAYGRRRGAE